MGLQVGRFCELQVWWMADAAHLGQKSACKHAELCGATTRYKTTTRKSTKKQRPHPGTLLF